MNSGKSGSSGAGAGNADAAGVVAVSPGAGVDQESTSVLEGGDSERLLAATNSAIQNAERLIDTLEPLTPFLPLEKVRMCGCGGACLMVQTQSWRKAIHDDSLI